MHYLERRSEDGRLLRARVAIPFPWARSAVVCFAGYQSPQPLSTVPAEAAAGWIARYAWSSRKDAEGRRRPSDYHKVLKKRLAALEERIRAAQPGEFEARGYVDTGPVVERALATAAGLGWTGKNTCLIHPKLGSFGFLAVLLTSLPVESSKVLAALAPDRCGTCRRCIDAAPRMRSCALPHGCNAVHLVSDHRAQGTDCGGVDGGDGTPGLRLRHLPGCLPWNSPRRTPIAEDPELEPRAELAKSRSGVAKLPGRTAIRAAIQWFSRCGERASMGCAGTSLSPWATAARPFCRGLEQWGRSRRRRTPYGCAMGSRKTARLGRSVQLIVKLPGGLSLKEHLSGNTAMSHIRANCWLKS